ncbi:HNH endonuclease [Xaviernesmea oryzae]
MRWRRNGDTSVTKKTPNGVAYQWLLRAIEFDTEACIEWPFSGPPAGYGIFVKDGVSHYAHRFVCEQTHGEPPSHTRHEAAHWCGNARCVNKRHIRWATPAENQADRLVHGTDCRGEKSPTSKLTASQVQEIRALKGRRTAREIAEQFNIDPAHVSLLQRRKSWAHLD